MKLLADFSTIGLTLASSVFIGFAMGYFLDMKVFDGRTKPWFMLIFLLLGIVAGYRNLYQLTKSRDI